MIRTKKAHLKKLIIQMEGVKARTKKRGVDHQKLKPKRNPWFRKNKWKTENNAIKRDMNACLKVIHYLKTELKTLQDETNK